MSKPGGTNADITTALEALIKKNPSFEGLLSIYKQIEKYLYGLTTSSSAYSDVLQNWTFILELRRLLGSVALKLIQKDLVQAEQQNVDYRLWMRGYYDVFHALRFKSKSKLAHHAEVKHRMQDIFKHGVRIFKEIVRYYESLLGTEIILGLKHSSLDSSSKNAIVASSYKLYTYIADLHRYASTLESNKQLNEIAVQFYDKSIKLVPDKYRAYHNLAIVHKSQNDLIATTYNFLRAQCLEGGEASRQELLELFDDLSKHFRRHETSFWHMESRKNQKYEGRRLYKTYWVSTSDKDREPLHPDYDHPQTKTEHVQNKDDKELYRKFSQAYCVLVGTFYTKIGLESLELLAEDTLVYFEELLRRKSEFLPTLRVVQITAVIIYMIHFVDAKHKHRPNPGWGITNTSKKMKAHVPPDWKIATNDKPIVGVDDAQHMENVAVDFGLEMFSLLAEHLSKTIRLCDWSNRLLTPMAAGLQLWEGWLRSNSQLWAFTTRKRPVFCTRRLMRSKMENSANKDDDVWERFAELMNQVEIVVFGFPHLFPHCKNVRSSKYSKPIGKLPECVTLTGFHVFASNTLMNCDFFMTEDEGAEAAFLYIRLVRLCEFGEQLCTKVKILEEVDGWNKVNQYRSLAKIVQWDKESKDSCGLRESDYQHLVTKTSQKLLESHLLKQRKLRRPKSNNRTGDCNNGRFIIRPMKTSSSDSSREPKRTRMPNYELWILMAEYGYPTELIVCPKRVVLDTNCLIRDLSIIEVLVPHLRYPFYLPVTVILELRGLSKGGLTNKQKKIYGTVNNPDAKEAIARNAIVAEQSKLALKFIEYRMSSFQVITSTGKYLQPLSPHEHIQDNYFNPEDTNDERILDSCKYLEYNDKDIRGLDTPTRVFRNTVLITGDQILGARTITLDIPTRRTGSFVQWYFSTHDIKLNLRFLWGIEFNPLEEHGLRYHTRFVDWSKTSEFDSNDDRNLGLGSKTHVRLIKPRNIKRRRNQRHVKSRESMLETKHSAGIQNKELDGLSRNFYWPTLKSDKCSVLAIILLDLKSSL
ncbi:unnamed protein product [Allacma fusca]|uniref:PIN domain-containing protein n=1 Tax=Allacma fusca TaxID=39272 RepID=A0A8J2Q0C5_9HEXA|nr:unnamed protein product [Allacma fusca]